MVSDDTQKSLEERVRGKAYFFWEQDGCPDGRSEEYWHLARSEVSGSAATDERDTSTSEEGGPKEIAEDASSDAVTLNKPGSKNA